MRWFLRAGVLVALILGGWPLWAQESDTDQPIVREIEIRFEGPETVNRSVVKANIQTVVGKPLSRTAIEQDVRTLIDSGYFFDVRVFQEAVTDGVKLIYEVQGKASVKEVLVEGQKHYNSDRLQREIKIKPGDILDELKVHEAARKISELYQKSGYPDIKVDHTVSVDKDTGKAVVRFKITEGPRVFIQRVQITGNKAYSTRALLHLLQTRRHWWGSWLSGKGMMRDEWFQEDQEKLRDHYRAHGYLDMEIRETRIERTSPKWMVVHIDVFEGTQYKVGKVTIEGNKLFPTVELEKRLKMTTGQVFTPDGLSADIKALEDYYGSRGYLDTSARANRVPNVETGRIDLAYTIHEGELTYIAKVEIRGNTKTKDKVIRRELAVYPGEIYDTVRVERSAERLRNLNYFSKVDTTPEPTPVPNRRDLVISVEEQRTGNVTFGAGFSSIDNFIGFVEVTQGNFDLFNWPNFTGGGEKLRVRTQIGLQRQDFLLSFTEPWFLDQKLTLGFDLFYQEAGYLSTQYSERRAGADLWMEKALNDFLRGRVQYSIQSIAEGIDSSASQELQSQRGSHLRSAVEGSLVYDTRDNVFLTSHGNRTELSAEVAGGPVGGNVSVYKLNAKTTFYFPVFHGHILEVLGATGVVDAFGSSRGSGGKVTEAVLQGSTTNFVPVRVNDVPLFDRYFLGGANTLRGFKFRKVGPKDVFGEAVGGNTFINGTAEYTIPVVERVRFALFFDIGNVYRDAYSYDFNDLISDAGIGVRLNLPIGPLRLDYGYPIRSNRDTGRSGQIQFSVGYQF